MRSSLTSAQVAQIPSYRDRWLQLACSTQPLDPAPAAQAIGQAYHLAGLVAPQVVWCDSPYGALMYLWQHLSPDGEVSQMGVPVAHRLGNQLEFQIDLQISRQLDESLIKTLLWGQGHQSPSLCFPVPNWESWLLTELRQQVEAPWWLATEPSVLDLTLWMRRASWIDFCQSVLGCDVEQERWQGLQTLLHTCHWLVPYENVCLLCDRPSYQSHPITSDVHTWKRLQRDYRDGFSLTGDFTNAITGTIPPDDVTMTLPNTANWVVVSQPEDPPPASLTTLTPDQQEQVATYRSRWRQQIAQTAPIDRSAAIAAIQAAYGAIGLAAPEIQFFPSPHAAFAQLQTIPDLGQMLGQRIDGRLEYQLLCDLGIQIERQISPRLKLQLVDQLKEELLAFQWHLLGSVGEQFLPSIVFDHGWFVQPDHWACEASLLDFCISVLGCDHDRKRWAILQSLIQACGWFFPMEKVCYICDRPSQVSLDPEDHLHAEGTPALQFADGAETRYAYHGVRLPVQYGTLPPDQWQVQWLLAEPNAELRRVLIQGIGYGRICQELQVTELDSWREYTLLQLDDDIDRFETADIPDLEPEPIHLLKMVCPSTGMIHAVRVPPDLRSAREAIRWVNWEVDPEEFGAET